MSQTVRHLTQQLRPHNIISETYFCYRNESGAINERDVPHPKQKMTRAQMRFLRQLLASASMESQRNSNSRKLKVKFTPRHAYADREGWRRCSSNLLAIRCQNRVRGQHQAPVAFSTGKTRYPLYRRQSWPRGRSVRAWKISPPLEFDPPDCSASSESLYRLSYPGRPTRPTDRKLTTQ